MTAKTKNCDVRKAPENPGFDPRSQKYTPLTRPVRVLGENILVQLVEEAEDVTPTGLVLPKSNQNPMTKRTEAIVLAVGSGHMLSTGQRIPLEVAPGDRIVFQGGAGHDVTREGRYLKLLHVQDVMAVL